MEKVMAISSNKLNVELLYYSTILLLDIYSKKLKGGTQKILVHQCFKQHCSKCNQNVDAIQVSINRGIDKPNVIYTYNGILFSIKNEWNHGMMPAWSWCKSFSAHLLAET